MSVVTDNDLLICRHEERLMGNRFGFSVIAATEREGKEYLEMAVAETRRIERLLTTYNDDSQTAAINRGAGVSPVAVDVEVFNLIERANRLSALTQGAFDLSYGSVDKRFWNFDLNMKQLPDRAAAKQAVRLINYQHIILDRERLTVFLKEAGMRIGFGGIGKGYAAERVRQLLKQAGAIGGIVNAAGDLATWGRQPDGRAWTIGIANPAQKEHPFSKMDITDMAVATSGDYEKFVMIDGKKYAHTIDPHTGYPVSGISSVTIVCENAEIADAMATPVMIMGVEAGLHLINQIKGIYCLIVDAQNRLHVSNNININ